MKDFPCLSFLCSVWLANALVCLGSRSPPHRWRVHQPHPSCSLLPPSSATSATPHAIIVILVPCSSSSPSHYSRRAGKSSRSVCLSVSVHPLSALLPCLLLSSSSTIPSAYIIIIIFFWFPLVSSSLSSASCHHSRCEGMTTLSVCLSLSLLPSSLAHSSSFASSFLLNNINNTSHHHPLHLLLFLSRFQSHQM